MEAKLTHLESNVHLSRGIRAARARLGLNQTAFAEVIGVSRPTVSAWERGKRSPSGNEIKRISEATGMSVGWLFGEVAA